MKRCKLEKTASRCTIRVKSAPATTSHYDVTGILYLQRGFSLSPDDARLSESPILSGRQILGRLPAEKDKQVPWRWVRGLGSGEL